ncbi:hypothetical protein B0H16DRAFT_1460711 [Mycena metata]|uniref:Uncharacterized protein n=1 Tax=Mycena metata TaxID=1033252 RepID=A0AAD7IXG1_9AGAR|nr:hypothetical protein B0H16DRAFT_1460711 [Mycena metata]
MSEGRRGKNQKTQRDGVQGLRCLGRRHGSRRVDGVGGPSVRTSSPAGTLCAIDGGGAPLHGVTVPLTRAAEFFMRAAHAVLYLRWASAACDHGTGGSSLYWRQLRLFHIQGHSPRTLGHHVVKSKKRCEGNENDDERAVMCDRLFINYPVARDGVNSRISPTLDSTALLCSGGRAGALRYIAKVVRSSRDLCGTPSLCRCLRSPAQTTLQSRSPSGDATTFPPSSRRRRPGTQSVHSVVLVALSFFTRTLLRHYPHRPRALWPRADPFPSSSMAILTSALFFDPNASAAYPPSPATLLRHTPHRPRALWPRADPFPSSSMAILTSALFFDPNASAAYPRSPALTLFLRRRWGL